MNLLSLLADPDATGTWTLVPERSSVRFTNKTLWGLVNVNGRFTEFSGTGQVDSDGSVSGRMVIDAASVRTGIGKRDEHLRSGDFFDTDTSPQITVELTGGRDTDLQATLTIRGTTLPLPLSVELARPDAHTVTIAARSEVDRTRWGVSGNMFGMMPAATALAVDAVFVKSGG